MSIRDKMESNSVSIFQDIRTYRNDAEEIDNPPPDGVTPCVAIDYYGSIESEVKGFGDIAVDWDGVATEGTEYGQDELLTTAIIINNQRYSGAYDAHSGYEFLSGIRDLINDALKVMKTQHQRALGHKKEIELHRRLRKESAVKMETCADCGDLTEITFTSDGKLVCPKCLQRLESGTVTCLVCRSEDCECKSNELTSKQRAYKGI